MKIMHLSDLHIGKKVNEYSMLQDQIYILKEILRIIDNEKVETVIIAGDVYDRSLPPNEALELFDEFLYQLSSRNVNVFVISGNHDSPERISYGGRMMTENKIFLSPVYDGNVKPISLNDDYGEVNFYLLPFIRPADIRRYFPDENIENYTDAVKVAIDNMNVDFSERNILITHQFVTGAELSESEDIIVGGTDNVSGEVFDGFDYVALGHIHREQTVGKDNIRYCGTPLKYSFSEAKHIKSVTILDFKDKENIEYSKIPLTPLRDMREIRGTYDELTLKSNYENTNVDDYLHITLTDEEDIPDAIGKLRSIYPNIMKLDYDNLRTRGSGIVDAIENIESKSPFELFADLFKQQNNQDMSEEQEEIMRNLIDKIWEEN
ncbi:MAG: exonuclease SbcCD subunit D [Ruminococcus sp.]|nr:exonuclease SbcCD subunit D [Ruminococcus sp.]MCI5598626.1 exonuclease SbcCD subunit D [Ruminococcus sp.]MCI5617592.1 exonuclease SbcCD subunit D [Ruminococcus sp.]MCI6506145.1 exonuclease SbcCD subunit D [Ruminococcus sp.]MDD6532082.1 exonuclease SbcCD subunit D [Ruminococcus sp.]